MPVHRENVVDQTRQRRTNDWDRTKTAVEPIEARHGYSQKGVKSPYRHSVRDLPVMIAKAIPIVIPAIQPHCDVATGLQIPRKMLKRLFAVGSMVEHTYAINAVKTAGCEGESEYIRLQSKEISVG